MYMRDKKKEQLRQAGYYFGVILAFAIGAGIGGVFSMLYGIHVIWISCRTSSGELPSDVTGKVPLRNKRE